jgi:aspartate/methionine/tyrosine aminotransferase
VEGRGLADQGLIAMAISMNRVFADLPVTVFEAMSQLARDNDAINLGQGFPDDPGPEDIRQAAADASLHGYNQYPSMMGIPELRHAIAAHYRHWHGLELDPLAEVMVTSGGTEALTSAILACVEPGDEVVVFQPVYDSYLPIIRQAGGIPKLVRLEPPHWRLTDEALRAVFSPKTKAVLFNNPLNPAAVVYPREDLELLARYCQEFDAVAICDEVWEHVTFDGLTHIPLMTIPGMRERTIKIGSAGKIFSLTGWKIGFVCAAPPLLRVTAKVHQFLTFTTAPNLQAAVAYGLGKPDDYFLDMRTQLAASRDRLAAGLGAIGFPVLPSQGTYFLTVDLSPLGMNETDEQFCRRIVTDYKVAAIPVSAFYEQEPVTNVVRFCFAKRDATLDAALERLHNAVHRR